jgi:hypothetical protein
MSVQPAKPAAPGGDSRDPARWTVMVFMGAATFNGSEPLLEAAEADIREMEAVGSGDTLNIFVQEHGRSPIPRRSHIAKTPFEDVPPDKRTPEGGHALKEFIRWALGRAVYSPATAEQHRTMLVLWGHAYDFAFGREQTRSGTIDALDFAELTKVLEELRRELGVSAETKLDILGFDACDLATVEMACQFARFSKYLLGSQIGIPIPGWPYDRILHRLRHPKDRLMGPAEFGSYVVRRFCESYPAESLASLSLLDLRQAPELFARAELLALTLNAAANDPEMESRIADVFHRSQTDDDRPYVDVADLCLTLIRESGDELVADAARRLGDLLFSPTLPVAGRSAEGAGRPLIVDHGRNSVSAARLNGLSIYAPHVAPATNFDAALSLYQKFDFAADTQWSQLVHRLARLT